MISHLKLPFLFEQEKLVNDLDQIINESWVSHYNPDGIKGKWTALPLYSINGDTNNIFALPNGNDVLPTKHLSNCDYFRSVISEFKCSFTSVRLLKLDPDSEIFPHRDHESGYEDNFFRVHIPIISNNKTEFIINDHKLEMAIGECWYTNVNFTHSVSNFGDHSRFHLVLDCIRNDWSDKLFFSLAPKSEFEVQPEPLSRETIIRMLEELKHHDSPATENLIAELNEQLEQNRLENEIDLD